MGNAPIIGNPQTSYCFRISWTKGEDPNEVRNTPKKLWPIPVTDIDYVKGVMRDHKGTSSVFLITNIASN